MRHFRQIVRLIVWYVWLVRLFIQHGKQFLRLLVYNTEHCRSRIRKRLWRLERQLHDAEQRIIRLK